MKNLPLFNFGLSCQTLTLSDNHIQLTTKSGELLFQWEKLLQPPELKKSIFHYILTIYLKADSKPHVFTLAETGVTTEQLQTLWIAHHSPFLLKSLNKLERLLKQQYLSSNNLKVVRQSAENLAKCWLSWQPETSLPHALRQALFTVRELSSWQDADIDDFREAFIAYQMHQYQHFFDTIEAKPLTQAQRRACIIQDERQLLLAGAGTGKTSVMVARTHFLLRSTNTQAQQILLLAYGNEASQELTQRLGEQFCCMTFHSLGMHIITQVEGEHPKLSELITDSQKMDAFIQDTLQALCMDLGFKRAFEYFCKQECGVANIDNVNTFLQSPNSTRVVRHIRSLISAYKNASAINQLGQIEAEQSELLECLKPIIAEYQLYLSNENAIDFEDMIARATRYIEQGQFRVPWHHIMVDEFQDISQVRAALIMAMLAQSKRYLFAVGDDWQSIYRFSGADVTLTTQFIRHFGAGTVTQLDRTFRYPQQILDMSRQFVCVNPEQVNKRISANISSADETIKVWDSDNEQDALTQIIESLAAHGSASVLILARFHKMLPDRQFVAKLQGQFQQIQLKTMTFHSSKGREAEYCILLGLHEGKQGFPSQARKQPLLEAMLPLKERFEFAEERRLFYVALTRAKKQMFLIKPSVRPCRFVDELMD